MAKTAFATLALSGVLSSCLDEGSESPPRDIPQFFWLNAAADSRSREYNLECTVEYLIEISGEISRTDQVIEYSATGGGYVIRSLNPDDGIGFAIFADVHHPSLQVLHILPARVQILNLNNPPSAPPSGSRFWDELRFFDGTMSKDGTISGEWLCAPLDIEYAGIVDDFAFAKGDWHTVEIVQSANSRADHSP